MDIKIVKEIGNQAYKLVQRTSGRSGPKGYSSSWPKFPDDKNAYGYNKLKVNVVPSPFEISRANTFWEIVNETLDEEDRVELLQWYKIRHTRKCTYKSFCKRHGFLEHTYRRKIDKIFLKLIKNNHVKLLPYSKINVENRKKPDIFSENRELYVRLGAKPAWDYSVTQIKPIKRRKKQPR